MPKFFCNFVAKMGGFSFLCLGSGSSGNCFYFQNSEGAFLIDAGIGIRKLVKYFTEYGISFSNIKAVFLTHDHIDHIRSAYSLATKYNLPIYATEGVWRGIDVNPVICQKIPVAMRNIIRKNEAINFLGWELTPFTVPHDSNDNVGYFIAYNDVRIAHVTDDGSMTDEIDSFIEKANHLIIESNYDEDMLRTGPYPYPLKKRISSLNGHLSNHEATETICRHCKHLSHVWLCHISANNNTPQKALNEVMSGLKRNKINESDYPEIVPLNRTSPTGFFNLSK